MLDIILTIFYVSLTVVLDLLIVLEAIYVVKYSYTLTRNLLDDLRIRKIYKERFKNV